MKYINKSIRYFNKPLNNNYYTRRTWKSEGHVSGDLGIICEG